MRDLDEEERENERGRRREFLTVKEFAESVTESYASHDLRGIEEVSLKCVHYHTSTFPSWYLVGRR